MPAIQHCTSNDSSRTMTANGSLSLNLENPQIHPPSHCGAPLPLFLVFGPLAAPCLRDWLHWESPCRSWDLGLIVQICQHLHPVVSDHHWEQISLHLYFPTAYEWNNHPKTTLHTMESQKFASERMWYTMHKHESTSLTRKRDCSFETNGHSVSGCNLTDISLVLSRSPIH